VTSHGMLWMTSRALWVGVSIAGLAVTACAGAPASPSAVATPTVATPTPPPIATAVVATASPSPTVSATAATPSPSGAATLLDGTWAHDVTRAQLLALGVVEGEDNDENVGHTEMELHDGTFRSTGPNGSTLRGIFTLSGNKMMQTMTTGEDAGITWTYTWELTGGLLKLGGDGPAPPRASPWTKVGP
jgi:hypothetical protein